MNPQENYQGKAINTAAEEYIPTKNRIPEKLNFNLEAEEYKPKHSIDYVDGSDEDLSDEEIQQQFDMIMGDVIENEALEELANQVKLDDDSDDSEDEDKWMPKYKDCKCCFGFVYRCKGETCSSLGQCYCKMKDDIEAEKEQEKKEEAIIRN